MRLASRASFMALPVAAIFWSPSAPAAAQNAVVQQFNEIRDSVGLGETRAPIDFSERPPLVVPPTNTLPPPVTGTMEKLPVVDPDLVSRRKARTDPRRPVPPSDPGAAATGLSARTYLIDPPAGMRNPDAVAADVTTDRSAGPTPAPTKQHRSRKKAAAAAATE